ncbi:MAG: NADH-quinone oxidoreductase subunit NuoF [Gemmataceae bacterium]|nr:NADH-quinone oxidoreductase subunit NuoF [Gemmataceae bacterium]MCI0740376.1 NADH-quinone oxidoreductase subunit NuoF [Gemmataceae bacterium]
MPDFEPVLLRRIEKKASPWLDAYRADGGYRALEKVLSSMTPAQVVDEVKNSGLRGRGGAGFPTGVKWTFLPKDHPGPIYLCVNADESEPCTFNNRILMEEDPHQVLEGILLASYATKASTAYIYLRYEYGKSFRHLQKAIDELYSANLLGQNILGKGFNLDVYLHRGAGAYICGEETGLIESLEGKRGWPRIKPPFPAVEGAFRKPTVVNNIETLACVTHVIDRGADWLKSIGIAPDAKNPRDAGSYGPKLYCISGHVNKPCCVELPLGISVRELVDKHGGGVWKGHKAKGCIPGGISMGIMTEKEFDTPLDFNGPGKVGCLGLGTAAVTIFDDQTSIVDVLYNICRFFAHESCGQCTPCREGTGWMYKMMDRMRRGQGRLEDLQILDEVAKSIGIMPGTTICGLADGAGWPVKNAITKFRGELEDWIRKGKKSEHRSRVARMT